MAKVVEKEEARGVKSKSSSGHGRDHQVVKAGWVMKQGSCRVPAVCVLCVLLGTVAITHCVQFGLLDTSSAS